MNEGIQKGLENIDVSYWKNIWNRKKANDDKIVSNDIETKFMELKRLDGNDTTGGGGVSFKSFYSQYERLKRELLFCGRNKFEVNSVFEVGCGSAPFLLLFQCLRHLLMYKQRLL